MKQMILLVLLFCLSGVVLAQDSLNVTRVGRLRHNWEFIEDMAVAGSYLYVTLGYNKGIRIVDVSDPSQSEYINRYITTEWISGVAVQDNKAYSLCRRCKRGSDIL